MPFNLNADLINLFYLGLKEPVPSGAADVTSSRITVPAFLNILSYVVNTLNLDPVYVQADVIAVVPGQRQYALPSDFFVETSVKYRGIPLKPTPSSDALFLANIGNWFPFQYTIIYPGTSASSVTPDGTPFIILDPPPSENSTQIEPSPPPFPSFNDPYLVVFYRAMIPTDFSTSNYTTYSFTLPPFFIPLLIDLSLAYVARIEGKADTWNETLQESTAKIKELNHYQTRLRENYNPQVRQLWFEYE